MAQLFPFRLKPEYRNYVWGGHRLKKTSLPVAEAWIVYENDRVSSGPYRGKLLKDLTLQLGEALLGKKVAAQNAERFPLLIKLLDCAQWLSLQVHPNDRQAQALEGEGFYGKTEAWFVLDAEKDASLIAGVKAGTRPADLQESIRNGTILDYSQKQAVKAGETIFVEPGTLHALGPGLLIYEVQQSSDLTYRVYDWGRPQTETRKLHIEKSLQVVDAARSPHAIPAPAFADGQEAQLCSSRYFTLTLISADKDTLKLDTQQESFHCLTLIEGAAQIRVKNHLWRLKPLETLLVPAACGEYQIIPNAKSRLLKAWVK